MSTIVVVKKGKRAVIGADTLQTQGSLKIRNIYQTPGEKIFKYRQSYIGTVGSTAFNRVLGLSPNFPGIHQSLGLAYEQKGEHNKAIEYFKKSI